MFFQLKDNNQSMMDLEQALSDLQLQNQQLHQKKGKTMVPKLAINFGGNDPRSKQNDDSASDSMEKIDDIPMSSISTQTFETAFVDCLTCETLQPLLLQVGKIVVEMCEKRNVPSSTNKQNKILRTTKLSSSNVSKWTTEVEKDLQRVEVFVTELETELQAKNQTNLDLGTAGNNFQERINELEKSKSEFDTIEQELKIKCQFHEEQYSKLDNHTKDVERSLAEKTVTLQNSEQQIEVLQTKLESSLAEVEKLNGSIQVLGKFKNFNLELLLDC